MARLRLIPIHLLCHSLTKRRGMRQQLSRKGKSKQNINSQSPTSSTTSNITPNTIHTNTPTNRPVKRTKITKTLRIENFVDRMSENEQEDLEFHYFQLEYHLLLLKIHLLFNFFTVLGHLSSCQIEGNLLMNY